MSEAKKPNMGDMLKNFAIGGVAGMIATCFVQPIDMVKVRIQVLAGEQPGKKYGPISVTKMVYREGGVPAFYRG